MIDKDTLAGLEYLVKSLELACFEKYPIGDDGVWAELYRNNRGAGEIVDESSPDADTAPDGEWTIEKFQYQKDAAAFDGEEFDVEEAKDSIELVLTQQASLTPMFAVYKGMKEVEDLGARVAKCVAHLENLLTQVSAM